MDDVNNEKMDDMNIEKMDDVNIEKNESRLIILNARNNLFKLILLTRIMNWYKNVNYISIIIFIAHSLPIGFLNNTVMEFGTKWPDY